MSPLLRQRGFSLMEILAVLAIIGVLTAIAIPSYTEYVQRGHRTEAKAVLTEIGQWQERFRSETNSYATNAQLPAAYSRSPASGNARYTIAITNPGGAGTTFVATATRTGAQANDPCGDFVLNQRGVRSLANATLTLAQCWDR